MWFFNATSNLCEKFTYGGCDGNDNRFNSRHRCERRCLHKRLRRPNRRHPRRRTHSDIQEMMGDEPAPSFMVSDESSSQPGDLSFLTACFLLMFPPSTISVVVMHLSLQSFADFQKRLDLAVLCSVASTSMLQMAVVSSLGMEDVMLMRTILRPLRNADRHVKLPQIEIEQVQVCSLLCRFSLCTEL